MAIQTIVVPDIGDFDTVEIIEVLVNVGDVISTDDALITLESDKASMEIPSPYSGTITALHITTGTQVGEGDAIATIELAQDDAAQTTEQSTQVTQEQATTDTVSTSATLSAHTIEVPDIGDFDQVEIIEILVNVGDRVEIDDSLLTLESDKAAMEIPATMAGVITEIKVQVGDKVGFGDEIMIIESTDATTAFATQTTPQTNTQKPTEISTTSALASTESTSSVATNSSSHASPTIRKLARELGVDLANVQGTGQKGRIIDTDLKTYVKGIVTGNSIPASGSGIPSIPEIDFSKFGEIEEVALSRINKLSAKHLHACWLNIPHVTQFDEADIEELETFRKIQRDKGNKMTPLVFIIKAVVHCLKLHPRFNASLSGDTLIMKKYFNIGVAVDTPNGLIVPVLKDCDTKSLLELQTELVALAKKAREGKLTNADLSGSCFSISSLGGIGGSHFTPIVNAPEVAILGVGKAEVKPVWNSREFVPTTKLPLALSYDHRVIDGALGARFITDLSHTLSDIREVLL